MRLSILSLRFAAVMLSVVFFMSTIYMFGYYDTVQAAGTVGISASGYTPVFGGSNAVVVDSGITINTSENTSDFSSVNVIIENSQSGDFLGYPGSLPVGVINTSNTSNKLTFTKTPSDAIITPGTWQALLRTVTFNTTSTSDVARSITFSLVSDTPFMVGNLNHYYQYISQNPANWTAARDSAADKTFLGMKGYLATITSADENNFIKAKLPTSGAWIGASDSAVEGEWRWVTGPEAGPEAETLFSNGSIAVPEKYTNWNVNEPNDASGEDYAQILRTNDNANGKWNDISNISNYNGIIGYVVEYGGMIGDPTVQLSDSKTIDIEFDSFNINYNLDVLKGEKNYLDAPENYTKVSDTIVLGIPQKTGYSFAGWYDNAEGNGEEIKQILKGSTGVKSLYATWTANTNTQYKVEHYQQAVNGIGYNPPEEEIFPGVTDTEALGAAKPYTGFTLNTEQSGTKTKGTILPDGTLVLALYYDRNQETIAFEDYSGTELTKEIVRFGGTATPPADPTRTGYMFAGWYKESAAANAWNFDTDIVNTNVTLFAKWTINSYSVIFQDWDGKVISSQTIVYGKDAIAPANPVRSGYAFTSWSMPFANVTGTVTAVAVYSQNPDPIPTPTPTSVADVLGANRVTAAPAATTVPAATAAPAADTATAVSNTAVLAAAKTGEADNQNTTTAAFILLAAFGAAGTVFVLRRKKIQD